MLVLDALKAFWILGVFLVTFFWLPAHLFSGRPNSSRVMRIAGNWARTVLCMTILVFLLCSFRVFGVITVVLFFLGAIAVGRFRRRGGMSRGWWGSLQATTINIMRQVESGSFRLFLLARRRTSTSGRRAWGSRLNAWL